MKEKQKERPSASIKVRFIGNLFLKIMKQNPCPSVLQSPCSYEFGGIFYLQRNLVDHDEIRIECWLIKELENEKERFY